jgi:quercetin dioxygenase-like cupin family protein
MPQTVFIDTNTLPREQAPGGGTLTEILNARLAGANNVSGSLRWLQPGETCDVSPLDRHQLVYVMDGQAQLTLEQATHDVGTGMGVYLGPSEHATFTAGPTAVKLFHLVVLPTG